MTGTDSNYSPEDAPSNGQETPVDQKSYKTLQRTVVSETTTDQSDTPKYLSSSPSDLNVKFLQNVTTET